MSKIIGIDLGTTNSCMAVMEGGEPAVMTNVEGARTTPSVVAVKDGERMVGVAAKRQAITNPKNTIFSAKRFIGRQFDEVQKEMDEMPFEFKKGKNGEVEIVLDGSNKRPAEISAMVLQKLKADAEKYLGQEVTEAVITVPAYFNDSQRQATKDAGKIAGLEVKRIINEPTAAALAYGVDKKKDGKIAVYDFGGGTFDISILELSEGTFEVLSTNGDTHLGGDDIDQEIIHWLVAEFKKDEGIDLSKDVMVMQRLKDAAEKAKIELSTSSETEINIPFITADKDGPKHMNIKMNRSKLEELAHDIVEKTVAPCKTALKDSGLDAKDIDDVILVGGQTRMPIIQKKVEDIFGKKPTQGINPDEVVALGAAIQGGILQGDYGTDILLLDVTPLSLGIETLGGVFTKIIEKNTTIPTSKSQIFSTAADNQPAVEVHVLQGERDMASGNKSLGRFNLQDIPPAPRGVPQIEVTFDIDANGILNVSAKDKGTGKEQKITIQGSSGLTEEEVEKMKKEAEEHAEEDKKKKEEIEQRNLVETLVYTSEKMIKDEGDKIDDGIKKQVEEKIKEVKEYMEKDDVDLEELKKKAEELSEVSQKAGQQIYEKAQKEEAEKSSDDNNNENKEDVVEGEVVDEEPKEDKKGENDDDAKDKKKKK